MPDDTSVSAGYTLVPHLSRREQIYTFPNPWRGSNWGYRDRDRPDPSVVDWLVIDRAAVGAADRALLDRILASGDWVTVRDSVGIVVAHRRT